MANEINIPSLDVAQRGILGMSAPQATVAGQGSQSIMQDPNFAGLVALSKTAMQAAATTAKLVPFETEQKKTKEKYEKALQDHVDSLVGRGMVSDEEAYQIISNEEGRIQREGLIRAYENFVFTDAIDKERTEIRLQALQQYVNGRKAQLTNADERRSVKLDTVIDEGINALQTGGVFGTDAANNGVGLDLAEMTTGEQMLFMSGVHQMRLGLDQAISDVKHERAIETGTTLILRDMYDVLANGKATKEEQSMFRAVMQEAYNIGVPDINNKVLITADTVANDVLENTTEFTEAEYTSVMNMYDFLMDGAISREDNGKGILFATRGTQNYQKLQDQRDSFQARWASGVAAAEKASAALAESINEQEINRLIMMGRDRIREIQASGRPATQEDKRNIISMLEEEAYRVGITDMRDVLNPLDKIFDNAIYSLDDRGVVYTSFLFDIDNVRFDKDELEKRRKDVFENFKEGYLTDAQYEKLAGKIVSYQDSLSSGAGSIVDSFVRSGREGYSDPSVSSDGNMKDILRLNNVRAGESSFFGTYEYGSTGGGAYDDQPLPQFTQPAVNFRRRLQMSAVYGGEVEAPSEYTPFTQEEIDRLDKRGFPKQIIQSVMAELNKDPIKFDAPVVNEQEAAKRAELFAPRANAFDQYQALRQALELEDLTFKAINDMMNSTPGLEPAQLGSLRERVKAPEGGIDR